MGQAFKTAHTIRLFLSLTVFMGTAFFATPKAHASDAYCMPNTCAFLTVPCCPPPVVQQILNLAFTSTLQPWMLNFYTNTMRPKFQSMSGQWVAMIMLQGQMLGGFYDAQAHSLAMLSLQKLNANAIADYTPGKALCQFGSLSKALASSDALGRRTKLGLAERAQNRQMLTTNMNSSENSKTGRAAGRAADKVGRLEQYLKKFCNTVDSNAALNAACDSNLTTPAKDVVDSRQYNRDIDYTRTFDTPLTLDLNFAGGGTAASRDQENLIALGDNLYAHDIILNQPNRDKLDYSSDNNAVFAYHDFKTATAKRSVVENSFASIAALKTPGTNNSTTYLRSIMTQLGMSSTDVDRFIGTSNPSYYAQMEVLSRKLYQDPAFFAELMDKPANLGRQQAAMKAIALMQERDIYDSLQRSEMLLSTLLEIYSISEQKALFNKMSRAN